jgi:RNA polymerase II-associated protein 2
MSSFLDHLKESSSSGAGSTSNIPVNDQQKSTVLHHARNIHHHRTMQEKVLDLIINAVDLPSHSNADPARPAASDATLFKQALTLFQPKDVDDMVLERNIYEKCGYALCPRSNLKQNGVLRDQIFRKMKQERSFRLTTKEELEKWCSAECAERALFVRLQLGTEPAWLRTNHVEDIMLLEESGKPAAAEDLVSTMQDLALKETPRVDLASSLQTLAVNQSKKDDIQDRMQALSLERGKNDGTDINPVTVTGIKEKNPSSTPSVPQKTCFGNNTVEGYKPKNVRFGPQFDSESNRKTMR